MSVKNGAYCVRLSRFWQPLVFYGSLTFTAKSHLPEWPIPSGTQNTSLTPSPPLSAPFRLLHLPATHKVHPAIQSVAKSQRPQKPTQTRKPTADPTLNPPSWMAKPQNPSQADLT